MGIPPCCWPALNRTVGWSLRPRVEDPASFTGPDASRHKAHKCVGLVKQRSGGLGGSSLRGKVRQESGTWQCQLSLQASSEWWVGRRQATHVGRAWTDNSLERTDRSGKKARVLMALSSLSRWVGVEASCPSLDHVHRQADSPKLGEPADTHVGTGPGPAVGGTHGQAHQGDSPRASSCGPFHSAHRTAGLTWALIQHTFTEFYSEGCSQAPNSRRARESVPGRTQHKVSFAGGEQGGPV